MNRGNTSSGSLELNCLRASKCALDEGLISGEDYEGVKASFLKAQQLRAGVEAGLIKEDDYADAKRAFMGSFVSNLGNGSGSNNSNSSAPAPKTTYSRPAPKPAPAPAANSATATRINAAPKNVRSTPKPAAASQPSSAPKIKVPEMGGAVTENKTSMSGIKVHRDAVNLYNYVKAKKAHKWMTYRLDTGGMEVVIADVGGPDSTYQDFMQAFPENECRYGVFDWEYINADGEVFGKLLFLHWSPDSASVKNKMMYASTKDFFKGFMEGLATELLATELPELDEDLAFEAVKSTIVRK